MCPRYRVALAQSRVRSRAGSSHHCHMILRKCSRPHIWTTIYLFVVVIVVFIVVLTIPFSRFISSLGNAVYSCLLRSFLLFPYWERRAPLLACFACLAGTITLEVVEWYVWYFLGGGWPDDVRFPPRSGDSPPLVIVWAEDVSIMRQTLMM
jgi:hypothetical protein